MKPHYLIRFNNEIRADLAMWLHFLENFNGKSVLFPEKWVSSDVTRLFTDASGLGLQLCLDLNGLHLNEQNIFYPLQIAVKEVFLIVLALEIWGSDMANWKFYLRQIIWRW